MKLFPAENETIEGVSQALRRGERTCVDILQQCFDRIDEHEPHIKAWVSVDRDGALTQAKQLDAELKNNQSRGPLHGIPIGIKDIIDVAGWPTAAGSELLARKTIEKDAPLVTNLRNAGAVILGKTVTTQFACFDPAETANPWNNQHTPGGSSSGSAAAVACGMCLAAVGSQTGGSITRPAAFCGVAGCKPSLGRVRTEGIVPISRLLDHPGPFARTVRDLSFMLDALVGKDRNFATNVVTTATTDQPPDNSMAPPRIGRLRGYFDAHAEPSTLVALDGALNHLSKAGANVVDAPLPKSFGELHRCHRTVLIAGLTETHKERFSKYPDDYRNGVSSLIEEGLTISAEEIDRCEKHQLRMREEFGSSFNDVDVLVCAAAPGPAPERSTTGDPGFNAPWSYTGLPTICFPIGLAENNLPLGIQIVGRADGERDLFAVAEWCERVIRHSW